MYNNHTDQYICILIYIFIHAYIIFRYKHIRKYIYIHTTTINERRGYQLKREQEDILEDLEQERENVITLLSQNIKEVVQIKLKRSICICLLIPIFLFAYSK